MKFCPYCGAALLKEDAAFCAECGKPLSVKEETPSPEQTDSNRQDVEQSKQEESKKGSKQKRKETKQKKVRKAPLPEIEGEPVDDGYDGYYNDVLPPDVDREKEGLDKELIKKISALAVGVILIIGLCVVMMYIL